MLPALTARAPGAELRSLTRRALGTTAAPVYLCFLPRVMELVTRLHMLGQSEKTPDKKQLGKTSQNECLSELRRCLRAARLVQHSGPRLAGRLFQRHGGKISLHVLLERPKTSLFEGLPNLPTWPLEVYPSREGP